MSDLKLRVLQIEAQETLTDKKMMKGLADVQTPDHESQRGTAYDAAYAVQPYQMTKGINLNRLSLDKNRKHNNTEII